MCSVWIEKKNTVFPLFLEPFPIFLNGSSYLDSTVTDFFKRNPDTDFWLYLKVIEAYP